MGVVRTKDDWRAELRAARRARPADERARVAAALVGAAAPVLERGSGVVACYRSTAAEPGTGPLRAALAAAGLVVVLPVVRGAAPLGWVVDAPAGAGGAALADAAVVLLPALAVDASGTRLGQGGGHYDRTLAALAAGPAPLPPAVRPETARGDGRAPALRPETARGQGGAGPLLVAVVHDEELLAAGALPRESHDVRVDAALTPSGWRRLG